MSASARTLAVGVRDRIDEVWTVDVPERAVDLRGVPSEDRHERVREGFAALEPGETFSLVSDRDPSPVVEYLDDLDDEGTLESVEVKRQNPETWLLRAVRDNGR